MLSALALAAVLQGTQTPSPLDRMRAAVAALKSVKGDISYKTYDRPGTGSFALLAPSYFKLTTNDLVLVGSVSGSLEIRPVDRVYFEMGAVESLQRASGIPGFNAMLLGTTADTPIGEAKSDKIGTEEVISVPIAAPGAPADYTGALLIDPKTYLPRGLRASRGGQVTEEYLFQNVVTDAALTPADFSTVPPGGYNKLTRDPVVPPATTVDPTPPTTTPPTTTPPTTTPTLTPPTGAEVPPTTAPPTAVPPKAPAAYRIRPGEWAGSSTGSLKASPKIGVGLVLGKPYWTFTVYTARAGAYDWLGGSMQAHVKSGWRKVVYLATGEDGGVILGCPKKETTAPDALSLSVNPGPAKGAGYGYRFGIDFKGQ